MIELRIGASARRKMIRYWPNAYCALEDALDRLQGEIGLVEELDAAEREGRRARALTSREVDVLEIRESILENWWKDQSRVVLLEAMERCLVEEHFGIQSAEHDYMFKHFGRIVELCAYDCLPNGFRGFSHRLPAYLLLEHDSFFLRQIRKTEPPRKVEWGKQSDCNFRPRSAHLYNNIEVQGLLQACCDIGQLQNVEVDFERFALRFRRDSRLAPGIAWYSSLEPEIVQRFHREDRTVIMREAFHSLGITRDEGLLVMYAIGRLLESTGKATITSRELLALEDKTGLGRNDREWRFVRYEQIFDHLTRFTIAPAIASDQLGQEESVLSIANRIYVPRQGMSLNEMRDRPHHLPISFTLSSGPALLKIKSGRTLAPLIDLRTISSIPKRKVSSDWMLSMLLACLHLARNNRIKLSNPERFTFPVRRRTLLCKYPPNTGVKKVLSSSNAKRAPSYFSQGARLKPLSTYFWIDESKSECIRLERRGNRTETKLSRGWNVDDLWLDETVDVIVVPGTVLHNLLTKVADSRRVRQRSRTRTDLKDPKTDLKNVHATDSVGSKPELSHQKATT